MSKKKEQLGVDPGTAANRLRKLIMFRMIKRLGENFCYQCGEEITNADSLSIEHKIPWLDSDNPNELFYDENNIAFSHIKCNVGAARKIRGIKHPSHRAYNEGCRCNECKQVERDRRRRQRGKQ